MAVITTCWTDSSSVIICRICSVFRRRKHRAVKVQPKNRLTQILSKNQTSNASTSIFREPVIIKLMFKYINFFQIFLVFFLSSFFSVEKNSMWYVYQFGMIKARTMWLDFELILCVIFMDGCVYLAFFLFFLPPPPILQHTVYLVSSHNWQHNPTRAVPASPAQWHLPTLL